VATQIVDDLKSFANYVLPESHAWSFALIAYATASSRRIALLLLCRLLNSWCDGVLSRLDSRARCAPAGISKCAGRACGTATGSVRSRKRKTTTGRLSASVGTCEAWAAVIDPCAPPRAGAGGQLFTSIADVVTRARWTAERPGRSRARGLRGVGAGPAAGVVGGAAGGRRPASTGAHADYRHRHFAPRADRPDERIALTTMRSA